MSLVLSRLQELKAEIPSSHEWPKTLSVVMKVKDPKVFSCSLLRNTFGYTSQC
jgi:hypothetical protein